MFNDLLDQPRRELEAVRATCDAQEARIAKLEAIVSTQKQQIADFEGKLDLVSAKLEKLDDDRVIQKTYNLLTSLRYTDGSAFHFPLQVVYEGMRVGSSVFHLGSHTFLKNAVYVSFVSGIGIRGTGEPIEMFMFLSNDFDFREFCMKSYGTYDEDWKLVVATPFEFIEGHAPFVVYRRVVKGIEAQWPLKFPCSAFYLFK